MRRSQAVTPWQQIVAQITRKKDKSGLHSFLFFPDLWTSHHGRGQRVCKQVGGCLCNSTAAVFACKEVRKCLLERDGQKEGTCQKETNLVLMEGCDFAYACKCRPWVITDCAAVWGFVWVCTALRQQQPVITNLDCCLLALCGLWRCTWEAAHTCPGLAWVLNWFIGPWFDALSWSSLAEYLFLSCIRFLHLWIRL